MSIKVITKRNESGLKTYTSIEKVPDQTTRSALDQELLAKITKGDKHAL